MTTAFSTLDFVDAKDPDRELILIFQSLTGCSVEIAKRFVGGPNQDLETALSRYNDAKAEIKAEPLVNRKAIIDLPANLKHDVPLTLDLGRGSRTRSRTDASILTLPKSGSTKTSPRGGAVSPPPPSTTSRGAFVSSLPPLTATSGARSISMSPRSLDVTPDMALMRPMSNNVETASHAGASDEPSYTPLSAQRRPSIRKLARSRDLAVEAALSTSSPALLSTKTTPALNISSSRRPPSARNSPPTSLSVTSSSPTTTARTSPSAAAMPLSPRRDRSVTSSSTPPPPQRALSPVRALSPSSARVSPAHHAPPASVAAADRHSSAAATQSTLFVGDINLAARAATEPVAGTLFTGSVSRVVVDDSHTQLDAQAVKTASLPVSPRDVRANIDVQAQMRAAAIEPVRFAGTTPGVALARAEYAHIVLPNATPVRTTSAFAPARLEYVGLAMEPVTGPRSNYSTPHVPAQQQHAGYEPLQLTAPPKPERT